MEEGWESWGQWCGTSSSEPVCGDGIVLGDEACDDGNYWSYDGCSSSCEIECGYTCSSDSGPSQCTAVCGDSMRRGLEECDDGNTDSGDGCSSECSVEDMYACGGSYGYWRCGGPGDTCEAGCGSGSTSVGSYKGCDDGNLANGDGCSRNCQIECGWTCSGGGLNQVDVCAAASCGDGTLGGVEECDDGNDVSGDGCSETCVIEAGYACVHYEPPYYPCGAYASWCTPVCGDGLVVGGEGSEDGRCEDGNLAPGDGCSSTCQEECGWTCSGGSASEADLCSTSCGDGLVAGAEECDDGNTEDGDGCSSSCAVEEGYVCMCIRMQGMYTCMHAGTYE